MKYFSTFLALTVLLVAGCTENTPLEPGTTLDGPSPIPLESMPFVPYQATWTTHFGVAPPDAHCGTPGGPGIVGEGVMTHLGLCTFGGGSAPVPPPGEPGCATVIAANGDELWYEVLVEAVYNPETGLLDLSGTVTYDGGTGRFLTATGSGTYIGTFDQANNIGHLEESGTLSY